MAENLSSSSSFSLSELDSVVTAVRADFRWGLVAALVEGLGGLVAGRGGLKAGALRFAGAAVLFGAMFDLVLCSRSSHGDRLHSWKRTAVRLKVRLPLEEFGYSMRLLTGLNAWLSRGFRVCGV